MRETSSASKSVCEARRRQEGSEHRSREDKEEKKVSGSPGEEASVSVPTT